MPGIAAATPIVRGVVTLPDFPGEHLEVLGIDVFTNGPFRTFDPTNFESSEFDIQRWLGPPGSIAVSEEFVRRHNLKAGDKVRARVGVIDRELEIGFLLRRDEAFDSSFAAMDIGWAQELFGRRGELSVIQLKLTKPRDREAVVAALRKVLPPDVRVASPAQRTEEVEKMLGGFELNMTAMSLVSLLVGMFLIYNTVSASVVRRHHEIGILRSLGATRNEVRCLFLGEAVVLGALGSALGLIGGLLLAGSLVDAVAQTISSLYVFVNVKDVSLRPSTFAIAWMIGLGSVVVSAWFPAHSAAKENPVEALHGFQGGALSKPPAKNNRAPRPLNKVAATPQLVWMGGLESAPLEGCLRSLNRLVMEWVARPGPRGGFLLPGALYRSAVAGVRRGVSGFDRLLLPRAAPHVPFQQRPGKRAAPIAPASAQSAHRDGAGRGKSRALSFSKLRHDRFARPRHRHDHRGQRHGLLLSQDRRSLDQRQPDR